MAKISVVDPNGYTLKLDNNRQAIADTFVAQLYDNNGALGVKTVYKVVDVPQTFGGAFSPTTPAPERDEPGVQEGPRARGRSRRSSQR